jgi:hypothetical protein
MPIERAEPAMVFTARVQVGGGEVLHLGLGDLFELGARDLADLFQVRLARALLDLGAFFSSTVAGGDFSMKVKTCRRRP